MDSNLKSCPECGHALGKGAGACAYCGTTVVGEGQHPQADDKEVGEKAQAAELPPPLSQKEISPADTISDEAGEIPLAATEHSESNVTQLADDSPAMGETSEPATEAETASTNELISNEDAVESKPPDDEQDLKSTTDSGRLNQDVENDSEIAPAEAAGSESVPDADAVTAVEIEQEIQEPEDNTIPAADNLVAIDRDDTQTETVTDDIQSPPDPEVADLAGEGTAESEALEETIVEQTEIEATQQDLATPPTLEKSPSLEKSVEDAETKPVKDLQPENEADVTIDTKTELDSETSDETIFLDVGDEVDLATGESLDTIQKSEKSASQVDAPIIEKDAQNQAATIEKRKTSLTKAQKENRQEAALTKAQALKKQKAALARAHALKEQKSILAKAAALKRKKAAHAKAQALKKQRAAQAFKKQMAAQALKKQKADQAGIEAAKMDDSAALNIATAADRPKVDRSLQADNMIQALLEKYKGQAIGINYDNSADIREAQLVEANADYFSVFVKDKDLQYSYPLRAILTVIEGKDGVVIGKAKKSHKYIVVIKVYTLVLF